jgi:outer membrane lipoprotein-sorting protein
MIKQFFVILLILSLVFISGCVQTAPTEASVEEQAIQEIEQEMEQAIEDVTMEDIENALIE